MKPDSLIEMSKQKNKETKHSFPTQKMKQTQLYET